MRIQNNFLCYAYAFKNFPEKLSTSMLSSHPLELTFGEIRQCLRGNDTSENAIHAVSKNQLRNNFLKDLGKNSNSIKGKFNIAGSVNSEEWNIDIPEDIDTSNIPNEIITICRNQISQNHFEQMNIWKLT